MEPSTVLFLAANPVRLQWLQLGEECRAIEDKIRAAKFRDRLRFRSRWAARPDDLLQALNEDAPTVLHFSGHGDGEQGLCFQAEDGSERRVSADGLAKVMQAAGSSVLVVLLNACYSEIQAQILSAHIPCVVGMSGALGDEAAVTYVTSFYRALAHGKSVANAHEQGVAALALDADGGASRDVECREVAQRAFAPSLLTRPDINANCVYVVQRSADKTRCTVVIKATLREFNADVLARVTEELRQWTGDLSLQITDIDEGSVRLTVTLSREAAEKLAEAKASGRLTHLGGFCVAAVVASGKTEMPAPLAGSRPPRPVSAIAATTPQARDSLARKLRPDLASDQARSVLESDLALLDRWRAGDSVAGNLLFKSHFASLYRFFEHKTKSEVDDLVQETFLQCVKVASTFRRQSTFRTYLFSIARNVLFHHLRAQARAPLTPDFDDVSIVPYSSSIDSRLAHNADRARLLAALQTLPLDQQLLLELHYWEGLDRNQLAEVFDVEAATIGSRLFRARKALQEELERLEAYDPSATSDAPDARVRQLTDDEANEK